ncbi:MAG: hypothetical protein KH355_00090 [Clostridiales bacterium]|nr:hypothetical protein [Clostridiales bacterium]
MITQLFHQNIFIYAMTGILLLGVIQKIILGTYYKKMVTASENMGMTTKKGLKNLKTKFENSFKLNMNIQNVDAFVDKNMDKQKLCGLSLMTWNRMNWQLFMLCGVIGTAGTLYELLNQAGIEQVMMTITYTGFTMAVSLLLETSFGMEEKRELVLANMKDYLDNYFIHRMNGGEIEEIESDKGKEESNKVSSLKNRTMDEDMEYLKKCLNEIASARNIEKQEITKKEEAMLEDVLRDFFL